MAGAATLQVIVVAVTFVSGMRLWVGALPLVATVATILGLVLVLVLVLAVGNRTGRRNA